MKRLCFTSLIVGLLMSCALANNSGVLAIDQWPGGISYTGTIYFPSGITVGVQFAGFELNWFVVGYSAEMNGLYADINAGVIVGRSDLEIYNLSFQANFSYGDNESRLNLLACNEYDPSVKKGNPAIAWMFHQYLIKTGKVHLGVCAELYGEVTKDESSFCLFPGPMLKYWFNEDIAFSFSPRASVELKRNTEFNRGNIYLGVLWLFYFGGK